MELETKAKLLQVTRAIIDEDGLDAVTLRHVGTRSHLSRGAAYRHFKNKEELLSAIATENFDRLLVNLNTLSQAGLDPIEAVRTLMINFHQFGLANREHYQLMFSTPWNKDRFPHLHKTAKKVFEKVHEFIAKLLDFCGTNQSKSLQQTAITYSFIHGLVELNLAGHMENAKGLDDADKLINEYLNLIAKK